MNIVKKMLINCLIQILDSKFILLNQRREDDIIDIIQLQDKIRLFIIEDLDLFPNL